MAPISRQDHSSLHRRCISWALVVSLLTFAACEVSDNRITDVASPTPHVANILEVDAVVPDGQIPEILDNWTDEPRVTISLAAQGNFQPGSPIDLVLTAEGRLPATRSEVRIVIPELEAARLSGFGPEFRTPIDVPIPAVGEWEIPSMQRSATVSYSATVTVPAPGYYHVVAIVESEGPPDVGVRTQGPVMDKYMIERWLLITEEGGALTSRFERDRVPEGMQRVPGPFRRAPAISESAPAQASLLPTFVRRLLSRFRRVNENVVYYSYYDVDAGSYQVPADAQGGGGVHYWEAYYEQIGADGYVQLDCIEFPYIWEAAYDIIDSDVQTGLGYLGAYVRCADTVSVVIPSAEYHAFLDFRTTIPEIEDALGYDRSRVSVTVSDSTSCPNPLASCFKTSDGAIHLTTNAALYSPWTGAHEFGHALHHVSLGGLWTAYDCAPHYVDEPSSYSCSLQEGFADWLGNIGGAAVNHLPFGSWESFHEVATDSVGMIEGNVAAMFHDLVDSNNEGDDATTYSEYYVATVFKTCKTKTTGVGSWIDRWLLTQVVWCYENRVNGSVQADAFPGTTIWTDQTEAATEPGGWDADDIRATWLQNVGS